MLSINIFLICFATYIAGQTCSYFWNTANLTTLYYLKIRLFKVEVKKEMNLVCPYYKYVRCFREKNKNTLLCHEDGAVGKGACHQG